VLTVRLLGKPRLERDGVPIPGPRGHKSWALLARLVRSADPVSRQTLVDELFSQADDPMAALRWSLAELRRRLGAPEALQGDPLTGDLGPGIEVDVTVVAHGRFAGAPPEGRFLERVDVRDSATFETWLLVERERVDAEILSGIREATIRALAAGDAEHAIDLARVMVARDSLQEGPHVLLISALLAAGRADAAAKQAEVSYAMLLRELGAPPSPALRDAARPATHPAHPGVSARAHAMTLRSAGLDALSAGVPEAGIQQLRAAAAAAHQTNDPQLVAECLLELGIALVHAVHSHDDEGAVVLGGAVAAASEANLDGIASRALAELGYIDVLGGRRVTAALHLEWARELAGTDKALIAAVSSIEGADLHDRGHLDLAMTRFRESVANAMAAGKTRREAWALGVGARTLYWQGEYAEARTWVDMSLAIIRQERWTAFRPWVEAWGAQVDLRLGRDPGQLINDLESTFALACQLRDACWQGMSAKVMGLAHAAVGDRPGAEQWFATAAASCSRETDAYVWVRADVALTSAEYALGWGDLAAAVEHADHAMLIASRCGLEGVLARASNVRAQSLASQAAHGMAGSGIALPPA
jgi:DNA-binding SARP family transcriptional activator